MDATLVTAGAEKASSLPIPPLGLAILAMAVFGLLLLLVFAFRSVSHRH
jgi:uncharacterized integral membrane protein